MQRKMISCTVILDSVLTTTTRLRSARMSVLIAAIVATCQRPGQEAIVNALVSAVATNEQTTGLSALVGRGHDPSLLAIA